MERVGAAFTSQTALQNASVELLVHADAAAASVAFSAAQVGSACAGEENLDKEGRAPHPTDIAGADEAFSIGFVDPNNANGVTVARVGETIVVAYVRFHFAAVTSDGVTLQDLATQAVDRLRSQSPARRYATSGEATGTRTYTAPSRRMLPGDAHPVPD